MSVGNWCDQCGRSHSKERPLYCNECHAAFQPSAASGRELPPLPYACHAGDFIDEMVVYTNDQMRERDAMWMERIAALTGAAPADANVGVQLAPSRERCIYIAGPMTGLPDYNFAAFNEAAQMLRKEGWRVENPADHGVIDGATWADYLHYDIGRLSKCGAIYLLPGWKKSRGAVLEVHIAECLGMTIQYAPGASTPTAPEPSAPADKVDAERYRWLRSEIAVAANRDAKRGALVELWDDEPYDDPDKLDAAIDRMRSEDGK